MAKTIELQPEETEHGVRYAIAKFKVAEETAVSLRRHFEPFEIQAREWAEKAAALVVTDESQTVEMEEARTARLALRAIRIGYEKLHKDLKEDSLRKGQLLDLIKRELNKMVEPTEEHLALQENFIEIQETKRKQELYQQRFDRLIEFVDVEVLKTMPLAEMSAEVFDNFLTGQRLAKESKEREEKERQDRERQDSEAKAAEDKRIREENERLQKERDKLEEKAKKEREKRRQAEAELNAKQWAEEQRRKQEQADKRKAQRAPDKVKLMKFASDLETFWLREGSATKLQDTEAMKILGNAGDLIRKTVKYVKDNANKL